MDIIKFWFKVDIKGEDECWDWKGYIRNDSGYGVFRIKGRRRYSHRLSYQLSHNIVLKRTDVIRHFCDNPACCNPKHLILGTHADNVKDRVDRNRSACGENNGRSKLSDKDALKIRELFKNHGLSKAELVRMFNVDPTAIVQVLRGKRKSLGSIENLLKDGNKNIKKSCGENRYLSKLKNNDILAIRILSKKGEKHSSIAKKYNVNPSVISEILSGRAWKHIK